MELFAEEEEEIVEDEALRVGGCKKGVGEKRRDTASTLTFMG